MGCLSKFAHKSEKNGYVARFNSLKNIPVYYKSNLDSKIDSYLVSVCLAENLDDDIKPIIELFEKNKIIVDSPEYDEMVFEAIQQSIDDPYISIMYLILTEKCNFNCSYCFIERNMDQNKTNVLTETTAKQAIDFFVKQINKNKDHFEDEKTIIFYGGEPLLNYNVLIYAANIIKKYIFEGKLPQKTTMDLITNGSFITEEKASELRDLGIQISISLDGATKKANSCRVFHDGTLAYDSIIKGMRCLQKTKTPFGLSITLSEHALEEKDKIYSFIEENEIPAIGYNILNTDKNFKVKDGYLMKQVNL